MSGGSLELTTPRGVDVRPVFVPENLSEQEAPDQEALLSLSGIHGAIVTRPAHERSYGIKRQNFDTFHGTLLLELNEKKTINTLLDGGQKKALREEGFSPLSNPHITVINNANARRIVNALDGNRKKLAAVSAEVGDIDWTWRPTGIVFPLQTKAKDGIKIVSLVECPGTSELFERLEDSLPELELEPQHAHISIMRKKGESSRHTSLSIGGLAVSKPVRSFEPILGLAA
jgi:hypothetical protein